MAVWQRVKDWLLVGAIVVTFVGGLYFLAIAAAPRLPDWPGLSVKVPPVPQEAAVGENRLYIPNLQVNLALVQGNDESILDKGAWHRLPHQGSPAIGGNFVISAHRFVMGWTPQQTRAKSPFYKLDTLQPGDQIIVDYQGARYEYAVDRLYDVPPTATEIEAPSSEHKLTLYSCDLRGAQAGRLVVEATPKFRE